MHTAQQLLALARIGQGESVRLSIAIEETTLQRDMLYAALSRLAIVAKGAGWLRRPGDAVEGAESALEFAQHGGTLLPGEFEPYIAPANASPLPSGYRTLAQDICFCITGDKALVTPAVARVAALMALRVGIPGADEVLEALGLAWDGMSGPMTLQPKREA